MRGLGYKQCYQWWKAKILLHKHAIAAYVATTTGFLILPMAVGKKICHTILPWHCHLVTFDTNLTWQDNNFSSPSPLCYTLLFHLRPSLSTLFLFLVYDIWSVKPLLFCIFFSAKNRKCKIGLETKSTMVQIWLISLVLIVASCWLYSKL